MKTARLLVRSRTLIRPTTLVTRMFSTRHSFLDTYGASGKPTSEQILNTMLQNPTYQKQSTGIVGVPLQPRWREMLLKLSEDVLEAVKQIPENTFYRVVTENNFKFFQRVVREARGPNDFERVEEIINRGQVEELILLFEDELALIPMMAEWKPWEVTEDDAAVMRDDIQHNDDFILADDYVPPKMKFLSTKGIYQVEWTQEELDKIEADKKKAEEEAAAKASAAQVKK